MSTSPSLRDRAEHAAKYGANLVVPAREIKQLLDERDQASEWADKQSYPLIMKQREILTGVAAALNGPPPPRTSWSHHDLAEKAQALADAVQAVREEHVPEPGQGTEYCCDCEQVMPCQTLRTLDRAALAEDGDER